jgi:hypothetical protein
MQRVISERQEQRLGSSILQDRLGFQMLRTIPLILKPRLSRRYTGYPALQASIYDIVRELVTSKQPKRDWSTRGLPLPIALKVQAEDHRTASQIFEKILQDKSCLPVLG